MLILLTYYNISVTIKKKNNIEGKTKSNDIKKAGFSVTEKP